jgi:GT2 family glycosyltransferase
VSDAGGSVTVVLVVANKLGLTRACLESLRPTTVAFRLCVIDNGSTDGTSDYFAAFPLPYPLRYQRNLENVGLIRALNQGARMTRDEFLCFLHNDTEMLEPDWLGRLRAAVVDGDRVGLAGLYGARRIRRDGRYAGRTIVHCLTGRGNLPAPVVDVAVVDGVCLFLPRTLLEAVGGFDEGYGFFHGYDRELSFAVGEAGWRRVVVDAPFIHRGGGTRTAEGAAVTPAEDLAQRGAALERFVRRWRHRLPADVRPWRERILDRLRNPT